MTEGTPPPVSTRVEYIVIERETGRAAWSDELYPSKDAAIASLCGPHQGYGNDQHDPRPHWNTEWEIRKVMPLRSTR